MSIAWNISKNKLNIDEVNVIKHADNKSIEIEFNAKTDKKVIKIRASLPKTIYNDDAIFEKVISEIAIAGCQTANHQDPNDIFSHQEATIHLSEGDLETRYIVEITTEDEEAQKITSLFHETIPDLSLQKDLDRLITCLSKCGNFTTYELKILIDSLKTEKNSTARASFLRQIEYEASQGTPLNLNHVLGYAISKNLSSLTEDILKNFLPRIDPGKILSINGESRSILHLATQSREMNAEVVHLMLQHPDVRITHEELNNSINNNRNDIFTLLFNSNKIDPHIKSIHKEKILNQAIYKGNAHILRDILTRDWIDFDNSLLLKVIASGNEEMIYVLLDDPRIDPNFCKEKDKSDSIVCQAFKRGGEVFKRLLSHPHLDLDPLFQYLEKTRGSVQSTSFEILRDKFPHEVNQWLERHPVLKASRLLYEGDKEIVLNMIKSSLNDSPLLNLALLMRDNDKAKELLTNELKDQVIFWIAKSESFERLNPEDQLTLLAPFFPEYLDERGVLAHKGITLLTQYLEEKQSVPHGWVTVCKDRDTLQKSLETILLDPSIPDGYTHSFIVTMADVNPEGMAGHVTPVMIRKVDGKWDVLITDSTTDKDTVNDPKKSCVLPIRERFESLEKTGKFPIRHLHINTFWRQADTTSCPIFSLRDIVFFNRNGNELLEILHDEAQEQKFHLFTDLPPEMMKITQSLSDIERYISATPKDKLLMRRRKTNQEETFRENVQRHTKDRRNVMASRRATKYQTIMINKLRKELASQTENAS